MGPVPGIAATVLTLLAALMALTALTVALSALLKQRASSARLASLLEHSDGSDLPVGEAGDTSPPRLGGDEPSDEDTEPTAEPED